MSYVLKVVFPSESVSGESMHTELEFTVNETGSDTEVNAYDKKVNITDYGSYELDYQIDDGLLIPSVIRMKFGDADGYLQGLIFDDDNVEKEFKVSVFRNGALEGDGTVLADNINYIGGIQNELEIQARPRIDVLNRIAVVNDNGLARDPLGYSNESFVTITNIEYLGNSVTRVHVLPALQTWEEGDTVKIDQVVGMTDANDSFEIQTINRGGQAGLEVQSIEIELATSQQYSGAGFVQLIPEALGSLAPHRIIEDIAQEVNSNISYDDGDIEIRHNWEFGISSPASFTEIVQVLNPLFTEGKPGINSLADVLRRLAQDWFCMAGFLNESKAFFIKLRHADTANAQTLGIVLQDNPAFLFPVIRYVKIVTQFAADRTYDAGEFTIQDEQRFDRDDILMGFYNDGNSGESGTNITKSDGTAIFQARDIEVDNVFKDAGDLLAQLYFQLRGTAKNLLVRQIVAEGLGYEFTKTVNYKGQYWQPIRLKKMWAEGITEIDMIPTA